MIPPPHAPAPVFTLSLPADQSAHPPRGAKPVTSGGKSWQNLVQNVHGSGVVQERRQPCEGIDGGVARLVKWE
jgi:hypothetical protein